MDGKNVNWVMLSLSLGGTIYLLRVGLMAFTQLSHPLGLRGFIINTK